MIPMIGSWIKSFVDGSIETGSDRDIEEKKASWSKGRLDCIKEVLLIDGFLSCSLSLKNTSWYQFDRFIVPLEVGTNRPLRTHRVIQAEIKEHHVGKYLTIQQPCCSFFCFSLIDTPTDFKIEQKHIGKWISIILKLRHGPSLKILDKGQLNDD